MPVAYKTTRYGCVHRCGTKRKSTIDKMETHEAICWHNRENKTCRTCKFEHYEMDSENHQVMLRQCDLKAGQKLIDKNYFDLVNGDTGHVKPLTDCKHWKEKNI